jgi:hypothetical protein
MARLTPDQVAQRRAGLIHDTEDQRFITGFDVVVERVVGTVTFGDGPLSPYQAAFEIIAQSGEEGVFKFPGHGDGEIVTVTIDHGIPKQEDAQ